MEKIPFIAWVLIGLIAAMIIVLNLGLWAAWKRRNHIPRNNKKNGIHIHLNPNLWRKPWEIEDEKWKKLNNTVQLLDKNKKESFGTTENRQ